MHSAFYSAGSMTSDPTLEIGIEIYNAQNHAQILDEYINVSAAAYFPSSH